jgi:hypothetical protein
MRSSTPDALPGQVPAALVTGDTPAAGTARPATKAARLAGLAAFTADIVTAILGSLPF